MNKYNYAIEVLQRADIENNEKFIIGCFDSNKKEMKRYFVRRAELQSAIELLKRVGSK